MLAIYLAFESLLIYISSISALAISLLLPFCIFDNNSLINCKLQFLESVYERQSVS